MDWNEFKLELDKQYRYHSSCGNLMALDLLDIIYDLWQKGKRNNDMIELLNEVRVDEYEISKREEYKLG